MELAPPSVRYAKAGGLQLAYQVLASAATRADVHGDALVTEENL
jgi:hypothetical protein